MLPVVWALAIAPAVHTQSPQCPESAAPSIKNGWAALRAGDVVRAEQHFAKALGQCQSGDGYTGLAYARLRQAKLVAARSAFDRALQLQPNSFDALTGRGMLAYREGDPDLARAMFRRALVVVPTDTLSLAYLAKLPEPIDTSPLPFFGRPSVTRVDARVGKRRLEVPDGSGGFKPFWVKAVNIGAALPGKHPSEFPADDGTYEWWLSLADSMGANTLRVYTIHPPHFYRALAQWNADHPARPLWLIHGVWTELPPGRFEHEYDNTAWNAEFRSEMRRVVDLLHGRAIITRRAGHASGRFTADVSRWTLGYIIGREWEPYSVQAYAAAHPKRQTYQGRWVSGRGGNAVETWLAEVSDFMVGYEMERYNTQRPMAYTNWPTLDPLTHPTETTLAEEARLLSQRGERYPEPSKEFDNDVIGLDATRMSAGPEFVAGVFASYHAYPYYPDFMVLDPGYLTARSPEGPSAYFGYLNELVRHHGDMPVVISEYGVPSSRGNAHLQPQGWHHGGHSEADQARINARLTREIHAAGAAGAGLFALIDEWFKKNWLVIDFEQPAERNRLWLNALDAEQNYGIVAMRAGSRERAITLDGNGADWMDRGAWYTGGDTTLPAALQLRDVRVTHNEAYLYLHLQVGAVDWTRGRYLVGISTLHDADGDTRLPVTGTPSPVGLEFVLDLRGPNDARLLVDVPYTLYRRSPIVGSLRAESLTVYNRPFRTLPNADGRYDTVRVAINRRRLGRDGTVYPEQRVERNLLRHARQDSTTLADWYADSTTGLIEVRIPWGMLHVLDPSSRLVLQGRPNARDPEGVVTPGFRFVVESYDPRDLQGRGERLPQGSGSAPFGIPPLWTWPGWETPAWHHEVKPLFAAMREVFRTIPDHADAPRVGAAQNTLTRPPRANQR